MRRTIRLSLLLTALTGCGEPPAAPPNVLLVTIDTLRADHTSAYGYARETTPRLAALAAEGVRVDAAYAPSTTTGPSHATLFTGLPPPAHGVPRNGVALPGAHATLAEHFSASGWQTAGFVSSFVLADRFGFGRGFERWGSRFPPEGATLRSDRWEGMPVEGIGFDRRAEATTRAALEWLREDRDPPRPFFLFVHYFDPHDPYAPPDAATRRFAAEPNEKALARLTRLYDAEIAYTDGQLGRLLDGLDALGLASDTLVVVTSDHGEGLMDHGVPYHGAQLYEEAVRVPLVVRWPDRVPAGRVLAGPVALEDLAATLLDLAGIPEALPGRSLAEALRDAELFAPADPVYLYRRSYEPGRIGRLVVDGPLYGVRAGSWKYIEAPKLGARELYDLERDPTERRNLAAERPETVEALRPGLTAWRDRHHRDDPIPPLDEETRRGIEALGYAE